VDRPAKQGLELERAREGVTTTEEGVRGSGIYRDTEQWNLVLCTSGFCLCEYSATVICALELY
jgi:hypothetical protein